jgi:predicted RNA binding protein YcfA (HicA-like mRNA interferase family)
LSGGLPVVSGAALGKLGWVAVSRRGSHVRLRHPDNPVPLVVRLHREIKRGTLAGILRDAGVAAEALRQLL